MMRRILRVHARTNCHPPAELQLTQDESGNPFCEPGVFQDESGNKGVVPNLIVKPLGESEEVTS